jgi:hypothetical protein
LLQGLTNTNPTAAYCEENKILSSNAFFANSPDTLVSFFAFSNTHHAPPAPTRPPNPKANPPTTTCIKPTTQMATYVATPDDFDAPFDALQNAVLPFQHSSLYIAAPNTPTSINTSSVKIAKKSTEPTPVRIPRAPTALTPEQESATISRYLVLADQERLLRI